MAATTAQLQAITSAWDAKTPEQQQSYLKGNAAFSNALNTYGLKIKPLASAVPAAQAPSSTISTTFKSGAMAPIANAAQQGLGAGYGTKANQGQTQNIMSGATTKETYSAPNAKAYNLDVSADGKTSFVGSDNTMKTFNTKQDALDYINKNNPTGAKVDYGTLQAQYNAKNSGGGNYNTFSNSDSGIIMPEDTSSWTEKDFEDFDWRKKVGDLNKSLGDSFNSLSFDNSKFKDTVANNMKTQMLKNNQLQEELNTYKTKVDTDFQLVKDKFDTNTQQQLDRINQLETTYMSNMNNMKDLQGQYFNTQTEALNARVGGEQAGLQGNLSARGIDQSVINDAITKAREKHLTQYTGLQQQNINTLSELNTAYSTFANDINRQKGDLSAEDLRLVEKKFDYHKLMADTGTGYNNALINNTFKPYEDAITEQTSGQTKEMGYQAADQAVAERFSNSSPADRAQMLQVKLDNLTKDASGKSKLTDVDMAMIKKAASMGTYPEAIQYLINAGKAVGGTSSGSSSAISGAVSSGKLNSSGNSGTTKDTTSAGASAGTGTDTTAPAGTTAAAGDTSLPTEGAFKTYLSTVPALSKLADIAGGWNPLKWTKKVWNYVKNDSTTMKNLASAMKGAGMNVNTIKNVITAGVSEAGKYANPAMIAVDLVNNGVVDNLMMTKEQKTANDFNTTTLNKVRSKIKELTDAGQKVPQNLTDALAKLTKQKY